MITEKDYNPYFYKLRVEEKVILKQKEFGKLKMTLWEDLSLIVFLKIKKRMSG